MSAAGATTEHRAGAVNTMFATMELRPDSWEDAISPDDLRSRLREEIARLGRALDAGEPVEAEPGAPGRERRVVPVGPLEIRRELRFLRQLARALDEGEPGQIWYDRAGLGSVLFVRDGVSGRERFYKLVAGPLHALDASQVSLDSALGRALRGRRRGHEVWVDGPVRRRRLRILTLKTLPRRLGMEPTIPTVQGPERA